MPWKCWQRILGWLALPKADDCNGLRAEIRAAVHDNRDVARQAAEHAIEDRKKSEEVVKKAERVERTARAAILKLERARKRREQQ